MDRIKVKCKSPVACPHFLSVLWQLLGSPHALPIHSLVFPATHLFPPICQEATYSSTTFEKNPESYQNGLTRPVSNLTPIGIN